mmetsp:Transcript_15642/g.46925  ORF Transcript_15642/g.46925 Transcript_15642/m.46925 type:complete len:431 (-) Transcript_15642:79-1371(-)
MAKKRAWTPAEDDQLRSVVMAGPVKWSAVAELIGTRNAKQCRERWHYQLNPDIKKGRWTAEEDALIAALPHGEWARVARALPGRTDMAIKNRYHTLTKRKCSAARRTGTGGKASAPAPAGTTAAGACGEKRGGGCAAAQANLPSPEHVLDQHAATRPRRARASMRSADASAAQEYVDAGRTLDFAAASQPQSPSPPEPGAPHIETARSTSSPELSALCDVAGVALDRRQRPDSCSPELLRVWARAAELGTPEPVAVRAAAGAADRSATISAVSALSALSRATRLTPIAPCGGPLSSPELGEAFGVFDDVRTASPGALGSPPRLPASGSLAAAAARAGAADVSPYGSLRQPGLALSNAAYPTTYPCDRTGLEAGPKAATEVVDVVGRLVAAPALQAWPSAARPEFVARALHAADGDAVAALRHLEAAAARP